MEDKEWARVIEVVEEEDVGAVAVEVEEGEVEWVEAVVSPENVSTLQNQAAATGRAAHSSILQVRTILDRGLRMVDMEDLYLLQCLAEDIDHQ